MRPALANLIAAAAALCVCIPALATPTNHWSKIQGDAGFKGWDKELRRLVQRDAHQPNNTFCLVVEKQPRDHQAHIYWSQENKIISWGASASEVSDLDLVGVPLDLTRDVVASQDKIGTSTYLVTRAWVNRIISACRKYGTTITMTKKS